MAAQNPYIQDDDPQLPSDRYAVTFIDAQQQKHVIEVDPAEIPYGDHGRPGSLLDIALAHGIAIDHACGGVCACSTCHVIVTEGLDSCNEPSDAEEDQLDNAYGVTAQSRLACQCVPCGTNDLTVTVPSWNRNLVSEGH